MLKSKVKISSEHGLTFTESLVSSDHCDDIITNTCYFAFDLQSINISNYFISVASISGSRLGPFSDQVKSVGKCTTELVRVC